MSLRVIHVDDDPDIREVVGLSLHLDSEITVISCADGDDALARAAEYAPDLILCDVMMPGMDGATLLARLRGNPQTAKIPVMFMTARAQTSELEQLKLLGAAAVFTKPFDPINLAAMVRRQLHSAKLDAACYDFVERVRTDAAMLAEYRRILSDNSSSPNLLNDFQSRVHKLSGAAGVFDFHAVSSTASALEEAIVERRAGRGAPGMVEANLDALLECIERE